MNNDTDLFHSSLNADDLADMLANLLERKFYWVEAQDRAEVVRAKGRAALVAAIEDFVQ